MSPFESPPDLRAYPDLMKSCQSIADLVGRVCKVPATLVMRKNTDTIEVLVSSNHPDNPYHSGESESLNNELYCAAVMNSQQPLLVTDALSDPDWDHNPDIQLGMISYYGVPVNWPDGSPFGTFCVLDRKKSLLRANEQKLVNEFAGIIENLLQLAITQEELRRLAEYDALTHIYSRRALLHRLEQEFDRTQRYHNELSIIYLDVDHFKKINDQYGHGVGDHVLQTLVDTLKNMLRQADFMGRLGGEEFIVCLPETGLDGAIMQAERSRAKINQLHIHHENQTLQLSVSFGVSQLCSDDDSIEKLINRGDKALYDAKRAGRNCVVALPIAQPQSRVNLSAEVTQGTYRT